MLKLLSGAVIGCALLIHCSHACVNGEGFLPKNDLRIPADSKGLRGGISETQFNQVLDKIERIYKPIVQRYGGNLNVQREWQNAEVNAYAERRGSTWYIKMFGGLARHQETTVDSFSVVACHEIGHHIAGVPRYAGQWAATEGQSDYFANLKCLRKIWADEDNQSIVRQMNVPQAVQDKCSAQFSVTSDQFICMRGAMAGLASGRMMAALSNDRMPEFDTPDPSEVSQTYERHPKAQCRLDTYYEGSLCGVSDEQEIGQNDPDQGTCNRANKDEVGTRPLCWYKADGGGDGGDPDPGPGDGTVAKQPTVNGLTSYSTKNPGQVIPILIDVRNFSGVAGFAIEASRPGTTFSNPNDTVLDPLNSLGHQLISGTYGSFHLLPTRHLPGWGSYQFRVIPLNAQGRAVGRFSNPVTINIQR